MTPGYEFRLNQPTSTGALILDTIFKAEFFSVVSGIGRFSISLPGTMDDSLLLPDSLLEIWRKGKNVFVGFLRGRRFTMDESGRETVIIRGPDKNELLIRRITGYASGNVNAIANGAADDILKAVVNTNLGSGALDTRNIGILCRPNVSQGPVLVRSFAWKNASTVVADLCKSADAAGTPVYWDIDYSPAVTGMPTFTFRTNIGQLNNDHGNGSSRVVSFGAQYGNLEKPVLDEDYEDEVTYVYAGGPGEGADRIMGTAEDTARSGRSLYGRREAFVDAKRETTTDGVQAAAYQRLAQGKPKLTFTGDLVDTEEAVFGVDWGFGDKVAVDYRSRHLDALVRSTKITLDSEGKETISARVETEDVL